LILYPGCTNTNSQTLTKGSKGA